MNLKKEKNDFQEKIKKLEEKIVCLNQKNKEIITISNESTVKINELNKENKSLADTISNERNEMSKIILENKHILNEINKLNTRLTNESKQSQELEQSLNMQKQDFSIIFNEKNKLLDEKMSLLKEIEKYKEETKKYISDFKEFHEVIKKITAENDLLNKENHSHSDIINDLTNQIKSKDQCLNNEKIEKERLLNEVKSLKNDKSNEIIKLNNQVMMLNEENSKLSKQTSDLLQKITELNFTQTILTEENSYKINLLDSIIYDLNQQLNRLSMTINDYECRLFILINENLRLNTENNSISDYVNTIINEKKAMYSKINILEERKQNLSDENLKLSSENKSFKEKIKKNKENLSIYNGEYLYISNKRIYNFSISYNNDIIICPINKKDLYINIDNLKKENKIKNPNIEIIHNQDIDSHQVTEDLKKNTIDNDADADDLSSIDEKDDEEINEILNTKSFFNNINSGRCTSYQKLTHENEYKVRMTTERQSITEERSTDRNNVILKNKVDSNKLFLSIRSENEELNSKVQFLVSICDDLKGKIIEKDRIIDGLKKRLYIKENFVVESISQ